MYEILGINTLKIFTSFSLSLTELKPLTCQQSLHCMASAHCFCHAHAVVRNQQSGKNGFGSITPSSDSQNNKSSVTKRLSTDNWRKESDPSTRVCVPVKFVRMVVSLRSELPLNPNRFAFLFCSRCLIKGSSIIGSRFTPQPGSFTRAYAVASQRVRKTREPLVVSKPPRCEHCLSAQTRGRFSPRKNKTQLPALATILFWITPQRNFTFHKQARRHVNKRERRARTLSHNSKTKSCKHTFRGILSQQLHPVFMNFQSRVFVYFFIEFGQKFFLGLPSSRFPRCILRHHLLWRKEHAISIDSNYRSKNILTSKFAGKNKTWWIPSCEAFWWTTSCLWQRVVLARWPSPTWICPAVLLHSSPPAPPPPLQLVPILQSSGCVPCQHKTRNAKCETGEFIGTPSYRTGCFVLSTLTFCQFWDEGTKGSTHFVVPEHFWCQIVFAGGVYVEPKGVNIFLIFACDNPTLYPKRILLCSLEWWGRRVNSLKIWKHIPSADRNYRIRECVTRHQNLECILHMDTRFLLFQWNFVARKSRWMLGYCRVSTCERVRGPVCGLWLRSFGRRRVHIKSPSFPGALSTCKTVCPLSKKETSTHSLPSSLFFLCGSWLSSASLVSSSSSCFRFLFFFFGSSAKTNDHLEDAGSPRHSRHQLWF